MGISIQIAGNVVAGFNAVIQAFVMQAAGSIGYTRISSIDRVIFRLNTVVVAAQTLAQLFFFGWRGKPRHLLTEVDNGSLSMEMGFAENMQMMMVPNMFFVQYLMNEVFNALLPSLIFYVLLRAVYTLDKAPLWLRQMVVQAFPANPRSTERVTGREAEVILRLPPMFLSLEYSYLIIYPAVAFIMLFLVTDKTDSMALWLVVFTVFFYLYQRFLGLWLYRLTTHDSPNCYKSAISAWGLVLSLMPAASVWWMWRVDVIPGFLGLIITPSVYGISALIYQVGLDKIEDALNHFGFNEDEEDDRDPGCDRMMQKKGYSWWSCNPIYVLKQRYCPDLPGFEVQRNADDLWPRHAERKGFFEPGTVFRHRPYRKPKNKSGGPALSSNMPYWKSTARE